MKTEILENDIERAAAIIRQGGLVAVPTETVYGLAGNGLDEAAVEKIYEVKGRPAVKPLSLMVPDAGAISRYCKDVPEAAYALAERFWPGPLTMVLRAKEDIPELVRAGGDTIGLRCPDSEKTQRLLQAADVPLAAPSANPSGAPSPRSAAEVAAYFDGRIDGILDGGTCGLGTESTIVSLTGNGLSVLRHGALAESNIRRCLIEGLKIIGVTGGTGCGKSTALETLRDLGALIIDADAVYYGLVDSCRPMLKEIEARFSGVVEEGVLQRKRLGAIVFSDPLALEDLRGITDRYVEAEIDRLLSDYAVQGGKYAAVDAINVIGTRIEECAAATVGIVAPEDARVKRLMEREGISEEYARMRIRAQKPNEYYEKHCTYIIANDGSLREYRRRCEELFHRILEEH